MNFLCLSIICCLFLSNVNYASQQPTKPSGWSFPLLTAIGIIKNKPQTDATTVIEKMAYVEIFLKTAYEKSIADEGFDSGDIDEIEITQSTTPPITPTDSSTSNSPKTPPVLTTHNNTSSVTNPLPTNIAPLMIITNDNTTRSQKTSSPCSSIEETKSTSSSSSSTSSVTQLLHKQETPAQQNKPSLSAKAIQKIIPGKAKKLDTTNLTISKFFDSDGEDDNLSSNESSPANSYYPSTQRPQFIRNLNGNADETLPKHAVVIPATSIITSSNPTSQPPQPKIVDYLGDCWENGALKKVINTKTR